MRYGSTRGGAFEGDAREAILAGLAPDGGLLLPDTWPGLPVKAGESYTDIAKKVFSAFLTGYAPRALDDTVRSAYAQALWPEGVAPLRPVGGVSVLELFHGPTAAFKDVALCALPRLLTHAAQGEDMLILAATSGDTGSAALRGFQGVPGARAMAFYPEGGVSPVQQAQMCTMEGDNVLACGVRGDFDRVQREVKRAFSALRLAHTRLSSANSINVGRLVPQMVYYFTACAELLSRGALKRGQAVSFAVPTGNFGDILAGYMAKLCGAPIGKLVIAANANDVLADFLLTGIYDARRALHRTLSPSMDILVSSNLERLLHMVSGGDGALVRDMMTRLRLEGWYSVPESMMRAMRRSFDAGAADDGACVEAIRRVWRDEGYLMDPHTAAAWAVMEHKRLPEQGPVVVVSTASPFKFPGAMARALRLPLPQDASAPAAMGDALGLETPAPLRALHLKAVRHRDVIGADELITYVERKAGQRPW